MLQSPGVISKGNGRDCGYDLRMDDRAGQIYAAIGGALLGAGAGLASQIVEPATLTWWISMSVLLIVGFFLVLASFLRWPLPGRKPMRKLVIEQAFALSAEIAEWLAERNLFDPSREFREFTEHERVGQKVMEHSSRTMALWDQKFGSQAATIYDRLVREGAKPSGAPGHLDLLIHHPTNPLGIREVSLSLARMAASLED